MMCILILMMGMVIPEKQAVYADVWNNAYTYFTTYGNQVVFHPTTESDGYLYYATGARLSTAGTRFLTVGWKVSIRNNSGNVIQTLYYQVGGSNMACVDITVVGDYQYDMYRISLSNLKQRMNTSSLLALIEGDCNITFDACMVVLQNGVAQGGINDAGTTWGTVYMTYEGIVGAANWSSASRIALHDFFNKSAVGLFFRISLTKGNGIKTVAGGGVYCYGTIVTVMAVPEDGYSFSHWSGTSTSYSAQFKFYVNNNAAWTAYGKQTTLTVTFYRNSEGSDKQSRSQVFYYGNTGQSFDDPNWSKEGYYLTGWSHSKDAKTAEYTIKNSVSSDWIKKYIPSVSLYGVWKENAYTIVFDGNGADGGSVSEIETTYAKTVKLPENTYMRSKEKCTFLGWSMKADTLVPEYLAGEEISVSSLAKLAGVSNTNNATITLYAIWDLAPAIQAKDLYYTLEDAQSGKLTELELASHMTATDLEDGGIPYGKNGKNSFLLTDYAASDFLFLTGSGSVTETAAVTDSSGNRTVRMITIHLVDTRTQTGSQIFGKCRFISRDYFEDERQQLIPESQGGLAKASCWAQEADYRSLLRSVLK